jgi:hypothetical protein
VPAGCSATLSCNKIVGRMPSACVVSWSHRHARSGASRPTETPAAVPWPPRFSNPQIDDRIELMELENHARTKAPIHSGCNFGKFIICSCGYLGE